LLQDAACASFHALYSTANCASVMLADLALFQMTGAAGAALAPAAELPTNVALPALPLPTQLSALPEPPLATPPAGARASAAPAELESALLQAGMESSADKPKSNRRLSRIRICAYSGPRYRVSPSPIARNIGFTVW
jgi:hypothetical protein